MMLSNRYAKADPSELTRVCSQQCGARCCNGQVLVDFQDETEAARVHRLAASRGKVVRLRLDGENPYALLGEHGGERCVFLGEDDLCSIYDQRPAACENFPGEPYTPGCPLSGWEP